MPAFCTKCGAALGNAAFCTACGTPVAPPTAAPAAPVQSTPPQGGSNVIKIVLIIGGILAVLILVSMGSCFYIGYRAKKKIEEFAQAPASTRPYAGKQDACSLIEVSEVSEALGEPAEVVTDSSGSSICRFKYGADGNNSVDVTVTWKGGAMAMKIMHAAIDASDKNQAFQRLNGIGDEAYLAAMGGAVLMRKGDVMVNINMSSADNKSEAARKIARAIAGRL
jgi:hypothetical protein